MRVARYQKGCVFLTTNGSGCKVWVFRWRETLPNGTRAARQKVLGSLERYATKSAAEKVASGLRLLINADAPSSLRSITMSELIRHYRMTELVDKGDDEKAYSTRHRYASYLNCWIEPRWGEYRLCDVKTVAVEMWLHQLDRSNGTKVKIRNIMSAIFNHAIRWEFTDKNPITGPTRGSGVRQSSKRQSIPVVLTVEEMRALLGELSIRERTMVFLDMATGLRRVELAGLKWKDVNFDAMTLSVERSVVNQVVGRCKTEASKKPVPIDVHLVQDLLEWRRYAPRRGPEDWVFSSVSTRYGPKRGFLPLCLSPIMRYYIQPAARRAGIQKKLSWHTFRHTFSTLLWANGEDVKVAQELLRHASARITMDIYTQTVTGAKRDAQRKVVSMILPEKTADIRAEGANNKAMRDS